MTHFFFLALLIFAMPSPGADLHGRVVDRGTLVSDSYGKGISGVEITVFDGKKKIGTTTTNSKGEYRIRKVTVPRFHTVYKAGGYFPTQVSRRYSVSGGDVWARDVYFDAAPLEKVVGKKYKFGYYTDLARGFTRLAKEESFFREDQDDSLIDMSAFFDASDSSMEYVGAFCEILWAEFLSQERPLETRYYLAAAIYPLLDSMGWGGLQKMSRYLQVSPSAIREVADAIREGITNPKKIPGPNEVRKAGVPVAAASQIASECLLEADNSERDKDRFLAQWKKLYGQDTPSFRKDDEEAVFRPNAIMAKLALAKPESPAAHYLKGRGLFAVRDYAGAVDALAYANRLQGSHPAARHMEAMAYLRLNRDQEALGRFQALREAPNPYWKAKGYHGLALIAVKEGRNSEAAGDLWKAVRLAPESDQINLLAEVSLKLNNRSEVEKMLQLRAGKSDHRAHYWLGRYGEEDQQTGVAEDHYRKAWDGSPAPEYAEALSRLYMSREEYGPALAMLEPIRAHLSLVGRLELAECFLQAGRSGEASEEYQAAFSAKPTPETLARYVDALVHANRAPEALTVAMAFPDQLNPKVKFSVAKANIGNHEVAKAKPVLEELVKREPNNPDYRFYLGLCHYDVRNWSKAKREFDEALRVRQDHLEAIFYTGLCGVKMGRPEAARNYFKELAQRNSADWKAKGLMGVGISFAAQNKPDAAENYYLRSMGVVETAEAAALLALSKRRLGAPEKWVPMAKKAYELDGRNPKAVLAMGEAYLAQGKKGEAVKHFKDAAGINPNSCDILSGMAKSQFLTGAYQDGRSTSANAIAICPTDPEPYYYAAVTSDKLRNRKEAEDYFKAFRKNGGDVAMLPEEYR